MRKHLQPRTWTMVFAGVLAAACGRADAPAPCCAQPAPAAATALPDTSVYQLEATFMDQDGQPVHLRALRGRPVLLAMIFTHCQYACPAITADLQAIVRKLPPAVRDDLRVVLVSMDAERDQPPALHAFAEQHGLDPARWTLLHGDASAVQETAAVLGVRYAQVENGDFTHSNQVALLDRDGRIAFRLEGLGADPAPLLAAMANLPPAH